MGKIVLLNVPDTFNYGSAIMGINFIHYLSAITEMKIIYVADLSTEDDLNRLRKETRNKQIIKKLKMRKRVFTGSTKLQRIVSFVLEKKNRLNQISDILLSNPLGIIILGGDDLSEYYAGKYIAIELYRLYKLSKKAPLFLVSQTIGPFHSWRKPLASICLKKCYIYSREMVSAKYLRNTLKLKRIFKASDLGFLDLPNQSKVNHAGDLLKKYGISNVDYITIVPSGLVKQYTNSYNCYLQAWQNIVSSIIELPNLRSKKIVLLAHVLRPVHADDRNIIKEIRKNLFDKCDDRLICITDVLLPSEARTILGNGLFTVTGRMHAAISTFQMLKPAISISYSIKYKGVIGDGLGMNFLIIEANSEILWSSGKIVDIVMNKIEYILQNYDDLVSRIGPAVEKSKQMAAAQIEHVAEKLQEVKQ